MNLDKYMTILRDILGPSVTRTHLSLDFDAVPGWDSVHLLWLIAAMERQTGRQVALPDVLESSSLEGIRVLYAGRPAENRNHHGAR